MERQYRSERSLREATLLLSSGRVHHFYQNGAQHRASASTSIKLFQYINIAPSINFTGYWYTKTTEKQWYPIENEIVESQINGFAQAYEYNASVSASTNFYGIYQFTRSKREFAIQPAIFPQHGL